MIPRNQIEMVSPKKSQVRSVGILLFSFVLLPSVAWAFSSSKPAPKIFAASAQLSPLGGETVQGSVSFSEEEKGLKVTIQLTGLSSGFHGVHIHEKGDCSAKDGSSAGGHYRPLTHPHGDPTEAKRHVGDLGNVLVEVNGSGTREFFLKKPEGLQNWRGIVGRAVIVHSGKDDLKSQPSGDSGSRIGCGVITDAKN